MSAPVELCHSMSAFDVAPRHDDVSYAQLLGGQYTVFGSLSLSMYGPARWGPKGDGGNRLRYLVIGQHQHRRNSRVAERRLVGDGFPQASDTHELVLGGESREMMPSLSVFV